MNSKYFSLLCSFLFLFFSSDVFAYHFGEVYKKPKFAQIDPWIDTLVKDSFNLEFYFSESALEIFIKDLDQRGITVWQYELIYNEKTGKITKAYIIDYSLLIDLLTSETQFIDKTGKTEVYQSIAYRKITDDLMLRYPRTFSESGFVKNTQNAMVHIPMQSHFAVEKLIQDGFYLKISEKLKNITDPVQKLKILLDEIHTFAKKREIELGGRLSESFEKEHQRKLKTELQALSKKARHKFIVESIFTLVLIYNAVVLLSDEDPNYSENR